MDGQISILFHITQTFLTILKGRLYVLKIQNLDAAGLILHLKIDGKCEMDVF